MKNSQFFSIISMAVIALLFGSSAFGQSLYTQGSGKDLTWEQVKDQNKVPTATGGLTGTDIDVNQDHPLISSSPYADRKIQSGVAIHTIANGTVRRPDFHKWTRWYQEDGNTQIFRMFKGEINVGNDIYYKPRIEAEIDIHSRGTKIINNADWVEWSGTYTFVKPVEAHIFQIWSSDDYVLMLSMKNNGKVQLNPRDQSGFRTILENGTGKSVHIRVRDYGNKYEVFVNDDFFYGRSYTAKKGSSRAAHFRWGIYAARKKGDRGGVPQDGMMFVTGAQRRFSNDPIVDEKIDEITSINVPNVVTQGQTVSVSVDYKTSSARDITAMFQLGSAPWTLVDQAIKSVPAGSGTATFELQIPSDLPVSTGQYQFQTVLSPTGGNWDNKLDNFEKKNIDVLELEVKGPYTGAPTSIPGVLEMENFDKGGADISYNDVDTENRGNANFRMNDAVDIASKNGGMIVGNIADGEWLEYTVDVGEAGSYELEFTYSSKNGGGKLGIDIDGVSLMSGIDLPSTGGWDTFNTTTQSVELPAGLHVLRFNVESRGYDLDKVRFSRSTVTSTLGSLQDLTIQVYPNPSNDGLFYLTESMDFEVFDLGGALIASGKGTEINLTSLNQGVYILQVDSKQIKLIK